ADSLSQIILLGTIELGVVFDEQHHQVCSHLLRAKGRNTNGELDQLVEVISDQVIIEFGAVEMGAHSLADHALVGCYNESGVLEKQVQQHGLKRGNGGLGQATIKIVEEDDQGDAQLFEGSFKVIAKSLNGLSGCFFGWLGP